MPIHNIERGATGARTIQLSALRSFRWYLQNLDWLDGVQDDDRAWLREEVARLERELDIQPRNKNLPHKLTRQINKHETI